MLLFMVYKTWTLQVYGCRLNENSFMLSASIDWKHAGEHEKSLRVARGAADSEQIQLLAFWLNFCQTEFFAFECAIKFQNAITVLRVVVVSLMWGYKIHTYRKVRKIFTIALYFGNLLKICERKNCAQWRQYLHSLFYLFSQLYRVDFLAML